MAAQRGRAAETLVEEAVERLVDYEDWFLQEVDKGLAAGDRGELIDHSDVRKMIDTRLPWLMLVRWTKPAADSLTTLPDRGRSGRKPNARGAR